jgi:hypothetical protein
MVAGIISGIVATVLLKKTPKQYFPSSGLFSQFIYITFVWGGSIVFLFLWINTRFAEHAEKKVVEKVISSGYLTGRRSSFSLI